jgi:transposase-like protein
MGNTPVPSRVIEYSSTGSGGVREYKLSPEELEEVRQKYPATKADKSFVKPVAHNPNADRLPPKQQNQITEEDKDMGGRPEKQGPNNGLTKQVFLEQIVAGETVASIEKAWGMKYNTLAFWVKKWDCRGITPQNAQELLAMMGEGAKAIDTPKETQLLREKEALPLQPAVNLPEMYKKALQEIEELKAALSATQPISHDMLKGYKAEAERWKAQATEAVALAGKAAEESMAKIDQLQAARRGEATKNDELRAELDQTITVRDEYKRSYEEQFAFAQAYFKQAEDLKAENGQLQEELNRLITERDEMQAHNDRLNDMLDEAARESMALRPTEPASEVQLLDRSIAELTRAKWILGRLSASGE